MFGWFKRKEAPAAAPQPRVVRARYDAAQTNADNEKHWAQADALSAVKANSPGVRKKLRERARYEVANNSYARGILNSLASYSIGTGPTLALRFRGTNDQSYDPAIRAIGRQVEQLWSDWCYTRGIASKLFTMRLAMAQDGEAFALLVNKSRGLDPIELDLKLMEADQFEDTTFIGIFGDDSGVRLDSAGYPSQYAMLEHHPGDGVHFQLRSRWIPASQVLHMFRSERPGQVRGIPEITPALPLFAQLRRFTLATLTAAETAADFAALIYQDAPADDGDLVQAWERVEIERGAMVTAPNGSRLAQLKAEHPNATYDEFIKAILREIARCISIPAVVALGDASNYNYASGRLDFQTMMRQFEVDQQNIIVPVLDKLFEAWLDEALLVPDYLPAEFTANASQWDWAWRWPALGHVDRAKEATGQETELRNNTTTLAREYAKLNLDWEPEIRQRALEIKTMQELGITPEQAMPNQPASNNQDLPEDANV